MLEAIIFDIDGTLAETEEVHRHAFNEVFSGFGLDWHWSQSDYKRLLRTTGGKERIRVFMDEIDCKASAGRPEAEFIAELHRRKTILYTAAIDGGAVDLRPGVRALIDEARASSIRIAIATTTSLPNVESLVRATLGPAGLDLFDAIAAGDQVGAKKPAPDVYFKALKDLELGADKCAALEDSLTGLRSAMAAGITTVITPSIYTEDDDFTGAALITPTLAELGRSAQSGILPAISTLLA